MAKGKYAARAANRLAEIDAGIVAELREKLAEVKTQRDVALHDLETLRRSHSAEVQHKAQELAAGTVEGLMAELAAEREQRDADRIRYSEEVFTVCHQYGVTMPLMKGWAALAEVFGRGSECGDLVNLHIPKANRDSRRTSAKRTKHISTLVEQKRHNVGGMMGAG